MTDNTSDITTVAGLDVDSSNEKITEKAFELLKKIRSVALATVNGDKPAVRIVNVSAIRDVIIYFLAPRGKPMYHQLKKKPYVAVTGMTSDFIVVRVDGTITFMEDNSFLERLIKDKEGMYAGKTDILEMFFLTDGVGEIFDLSSGLPMRLPFSFGNAHIKEQGYRITNSCSACGICKEACTCNAISEGTIYLINPVKCLHCGRCFEKCPDKAIIPVNIDPIS